jgi:hypothetical protein
LVVPGLTVTTTVKLDVAALANEGFVQLRVPVDPVAVGEQVQPAGTLMDWSVVFAGIDWLKTAPEAVEGPLLVTD